MQVVAAARPTQYMFKKEKNSNNISHIENQYELEKAKRIIAKNETQIQSELATLKFWKMVALMSFLTIVFLGYALFNKYKLAKLITLDNKVIPSFCQHATSIRQI